jgi:integrase
MFGLQGGREKFDYVNGGNAKWIEKIHKVKLDRLTPERIQAYKVRYLKEASSDPLSLKRAQTTLNSVLRASKCLFTPRIQKQIGKTVPNPFKEIENIKLPKNRYRSEINPDLLLMQARRELMEQHPEEFKVLILALGCGLRRDEIDTLAWSQVDYARNQIRIETTEHTTAKSDESEALVDVDPGLIEMLRSFMAASQSPFVINSPNAPRPNAASYHHYRCSKVFDRLIAWLHSKGMKARNALHTLRKEFGSQICAQAGIYAASTALRHANIALTASVYTDKKRTVFYSVAKALTELEVVPTEKKG